MGMMMTICGSKYSDTGLALPVHIAIIYVFTATVKCRDHAMDMMMTMMMKSVKCI